MRTRINVCADGSDRVDIYLGDATWYSVYDKDGPGNRVVIEAKPFEDRTPFLRLTLEEYRSLVDSILQEEMPQIASAQLSFAERDDAIVVRDRMISLVETLISQ